MRKTELYNDLSPSLITKTKLKKDQQVVWRVAKRYKDPMNPGQEVVPVAVKVPPVDTIFDKEKGEFVNIAAIRGVDAKGEHTFHDIIFWGDSEGIMILTGGRALDQEIHTYLSLCNFNGSNPDRDDTKEVVFELVDETAKAEKESKNRNLKREALNAAADLKVEEVRDYIAALGQDDKRDISVLRNVLEELADRDPKAFFELINNKQAVIKATINRALAKGVIVFDAPQSRYTWDSGEIILTVARTTGLNPVEELVGFCVSSAKGEKVFQTIASKLKK